MNLDQPLQFFVIKDTQQSSLKNKLHVPIHYNNVVHPSDNEGKAVTRLGCLHATQEIFFWQYKSVQVKPSSSMALNIVHQFGVIRRSYYTKHFAQKDCRQHEDIKFFCAGGHFSRGPTVWILQLFLFLFLHRKFLLQNQQTFQFVPEPYSSYSRDGHMTARTSTMGSTCDDQQDVWSSLELCLNLMRPYLYISLIVTQQTLKALWV